MKTDMLHIRIPIEESQILKKMADRCGISSNLLSAKMVVAAVKALAGYNGPILPLTLEFPHKIASQTKAK